MTPARRMKGAESSAKGEEHLFSSMGCVSLNDRSRMVTRMAENIAIVENLLGGYRFRQPGLLAEALTHPSHSPQGPNYERLEFIGDAVLSLIMSTYLYANSNVGPGHLTLIRAANISNEKLARIAVRHHLYPLLLRDSRDLDSLVDHFAAVVGEENVVGDFDGSVTYGGTTVGAPKVLADVVESIIGAVYVDCGFKLETTWVSVRKMLEPIITKENHHEQPMSRLNEICQKSGRTMEIKSWIDGAKYHMNVLVDGNQVGVSCSHKKNIAKLNAVRDALSKLDVKDSFTPTPDAKSATADRYTYSTTLSSRVADLTAKPTTITTTDLEKEGKKNLNVLCAKNHWTKPIYRVETKGPAHGRSFRCSVEVTTSPSGGAVVTSGESKSKIKDAENSAAYRMLIKLRSINH